MKRKEFLKGLGLIGLGSLVPVNRTHGATDTITGKKPGSCTLIPSETPGPFPLDLTTNNFYFRHDVREDRTGEDLYLRIKVTGNSNCEPMPNVRVNIWHCNKDGFYSGYDQPGNPGQAGHTYLRGYQITDVNGRVEFLTIFPGWYPGRVCHVHFQVYVSSVYAAVSQLTFDTTMKNHIYANNPLYTKGADPVAISSDGVFADGHGLQLTNMSAILAGGYVAELEVTIQGSGTVSGLGALEPETGNQFRLGQNFPNPCNGQTTVPFTLNNAGDVTVNIYDTMGRRVSSQIQGHLNAGRHELLLDFAELNLALQNYAYELVVANSTGTYKKTMLITAAL